jgi:hypothetical protein
MLGWHGGEDVAAHDLFATCKKKSGKQKKKCLKKARKHAATHTATPTTGLSCPSGQRPCRGACLSVLICCDASDCAGGRTCQQGTCACPPDEPHDNCAPGNTVCQQCCTVTDCRPNIYNDNQACTNGQCVCPAPTHRCPSGSENAGRCGQCCNDSDCPGAAFCFQVQGSGSAICRCTTSAECEGFCASPLCEDLCDIQCPQGVAIGEPCCSGTDPLICRPNFPEDTRGTCQP